MLISLNWLRDFVELPRDIDPRALGERFTVTSAEVDDVREIAVRAAGLVAARIVRSEPISAATRKLNAVTLDLGANKTVETVSAAPSLPVGALLVYAPDGANVAALGRIAATTVAGRTSHGLILPGESIGIEKAIQEAIFLSDEFAPGDSLPAELFDDWVIEVDNKSITHRPDLWGHYGIAREVAAMLNLPLKPYDELLVPEFELARHDLPEIPITIADPNACRRYSALRLENVPVQPAPLWMQLRLGHVGLRPISGLVDLTNYLMCDLGQPMHAFDAGKVSRIEVDLAKEGERHRTLDGVERVLTEHDLMIQSGGRSIALAGVMGGAETEVSPVTTSLLLESANFSPTVVRKTATRLGLRTDASARFEKSLDPVHTVLGIRRFVRLARDMYSGMQITSRLSDAYPNPHEPITVSVAPHHVARTVGRTLSIADAQALLAPLGFDVSGGADRWSVRVPSWRGTGDCAIEADIIEEIARSIGYGSIPPAMPQVSMRRFAPNALHELEHKSLEYFTLAHRFHEIYRYLWYDDAWLRQLSYDPGDCFELRNPAAEGMHRLRKTLLPGLLATVVTNRFHFSEFNLIEIGSVFQPVAAMNAAWNGADAPHARVDGASPSGSEFRHLGLIAARRAKQADDELIAALKGAVECWIWQRFARPVSFAPASRDQSRPWEHAERIAEITVDGVSVGRISVLDAALRRTMDEHLSAWSVAWAEVRLNPLAALTPTVERIASIPAFPRVELDFSLLVPAESRYADIAANLAGFAHPLLQETRFVTAFQGGSLPAGRRSLTFRTVLGDDARTLTEADTAGFKEAFEQHAARHGYNLRK